MGNESWKRPQEATLYIFLFVFSSCVFYRKDMGMKNLSYMLGSLGYSVLKKTALSYFLLCEFHCEHMLQDKTPFLPRNKNTQPNKDTWAGLILSQIKKNCQAELISNNQFTPVELYYTRLVDVKRHYFSPLKSTGTRFQAQPDLLILIQPSGLLSTHFFCGGSCHFWYF